MRYLYVRRLIKHYYYNIPSLLTNCSIYDVASSHFIQLLLASQFTHAEILLVWQHNNSDQYHLTKVAVLTWCNLSNWFYSKRSDGIQQTSDELWSTINIYIIDWIYHRHFFGDDSLWNCSCLNVLIGCSLLTYNVVDGCTGIDELMFRVVFIRRRYMM